MNYDDIIKRIEQLHTDIGDVYGRFSDTYEATGKLYALAGIEAAKIEALPPRKRPVLSDQQEYAAAHAHQTFENARALNSRR